VENSTKFLLLAATRGWSKPETGKKFKVFQCQSNLMVVVHDGSIQKSALSIGVFFGKGVLFLQDLRGSC
jgi:hypothetical protein